MLHKALLVTVLLYSSKAMKLRDKERSWIRALQMANLGGLLGIRRMDKILNG